MELLYSWAARILALGVAALLWWRGRRDPRYRSDLTQRYGYGEPAAKPDGLWIHAASVGEVQAAVSLVGALRERFSTRHIVVTTATPTGQERARSVLPAQVEVRFAPFDLPGAANRFLDRVQPCMAIFIETELWPNLIAASAARGIPLALVSARVSQRSARRYARFAASLMARTLQHLSLIAAQTGSDGRRFVGLGADAARVQVVGNLKFDISLPPDLDQRGAALLARYLPVGKRPVWVAGSTHPGEEEILLRAHRELLQTLPRALLIMAPRHPQRFAAAAAGVEKSGLTFQRRSRESQTVTAESQVLLVDKLGELLAFYTFADVVYVGGSLVAVGGHNLLEPAALGRALLAGPHLFAAPQVADLLREVGALEIVTNAPALADALRRLLGDVAERARRGNKALGAVEANRGTAARMVELIAPLIREPAAPAPAEASSPGP